ncbi:MAG: PQQ-like beta-propeller repeat protein, partial [Planctomycetes bacterium]|nr:PQQ-like beta-propeller repeat protein [Planctomycetota bacterium]
MFTTITLLFFATVPQYAPGDTVWETQLWGEMMSSPSVGPNGNIYIATQEWGGVIYRIDGPTGDVLAWNYTPGAVEHAPAIADNGLVYVNTLRQSVYKGLDAGGNPIYVAGRATTCAFDA